MEKIAAFVFLVLAVANQQHINSTKVSCKNTMPKADGSSEGFTQETLENLSSVLKMIVRLDRPASSV